MKTSRITQTGQIPVTISGLWSLHPLVPLAGEKDYEAASAICVRLSVRRLNAVQKEYFRELTGLVEEYEGQHRLLEKTEKALRKLAASSSKTSPAKSTP
jgi:hypothetical protein